MPARCPTGLSGPSKKNATKKSQTDSCLSTRCPDMCQKGSEGRGALLMEIQRRERVVLVAPAHGGQVGVYTLQLFKVIFFFFLYFFSLIVGVRLVPFFLSFLPNSLGQVNFILVVIFYSHKTIL